MSVKDIGISKNVIQCVNKKGWKGIISPQTDSMPSVDRAISCFNKLVFVFQFLN